MAYIKNNWVDREGTTRYFETVDDDGALILTPDYTQVTEMGTPVNADNMNHIEDGIAAGSFTKYDTMATYAKNDLVTTIVDNELKVYKSLQDNNTNTLDNSSSWEEVEFSGGGGSGLQMFDTVLKDHVLTYEESKGLALQGTYVYKDAIAGSRYGYPDFYNKVVEEYNEGTLVQGIPFEQPILTANGTVGGNQFAVESGDESSGYQAWKAFDADNSTNWLTNVIGASALPASITFYNPKSLNVTNLEIINRAGSATAPTAGAVYGSSDNSIWEKISDFTNDTVTSANGIWNIDLSSNTKFYKYHKIEITDGVFGATNHSMGVSGINITATYREIDATLYKNSNGHIFYDISEKDKVDEYFNKFGTAWFYGVDTENERVFLPRNNYFDQATGNISEVGQSVEAGLPNITGKFWVADRGSTAAPTKATGAFAKDGTWSAAVAGGNADSWGGVFSFAASRSSEVYGNSDTVQPNAVKKLLYICVGNTVADTSWVDVVTQVEGGVKDLEDKTNEGIEALSNASNTLRQTQITNCLLEVPQNIKLELNNGTLTLKAGSKVIVPNGVGKFEEVVIESDLTQKPTGRLNGSKDVIFVTNNGKSFNITNSNTVSGATVPTGTCLWYDTTNNVVHKVNNGVADTAIASFPLCIVQAGADGMISSIDQVFNGMGYIGSTLWVDKDIKALFPWGRNTDGTLNNIEGSTQVVKTYTAPSNYTNPSAQLVIDSAGGIAPNTAGIACNGYIEVEEIPTSKLDNVVWILHTPSNRVYQWNATTSKYELKNAGLVAVVDVSITAGVITSFRPKLPFRAVDQNEFNKSEISGWAMPSNKRVDITLGASGTTYTAPANGWFNFVAVSSTTVSSIGIANTTSGLNSFVPCSIKQTSLQLYVPVKKGDVCKVVYSNIDNNYTDFKFIYAEGDK